MSDIQVVASSDGFKVKDVEKFRSAMEEIGVVTEVRNIDENFVMIHCNGDSWPNDYVKDGAFTIIDLPKIISGHLIGGSIAILREVSIDRFEVGGQAIAVDSSGNRVEVSLEDIYPKSSHLLQEDDE